MAPWAEIEVRWVEGMIRIHQGRGGEAVAAVDRAVALSHELGASDPKRVHALLERLKVALRLGDAEATLPLCDEVEALSDACAVDRHQLTLWRAAASYHRGRAEAAAGRDGAAEACLLLRLAAGRPREAAALASEVASILGAAAASAEDLAAIQALNRAATVAEVSDGDLDGAEAVLRRLEYERRTRRALDLAL